jgi:hypothetical protein
VCREDGATGYGSGRVNLWVSWFINSPFQPYTFQLYACLEIRRERRSL